MFGFLPIPAVIAHRGASAYAPENTLAAFELAVRQGADAIELDAKLTADGQVVVFHDQTLDRTTGVPGKIHNSKWADLKKLDAGSHFDVAYRSEPIPLLSDVLDAVGRFTFTNIELTNYNSPFDNLPERVAEIVKRQKMANRVFFSSFNPIGLMRIRRLLPKVPISLLAQPGKSGILARSFLIYAIGFDSLNPFLSDATDRLVSRLHRRKSKVFVYTVNEPDVMRELFDLGVDGIFTDDPLIARRVLSTVRQQHLKDVNR